AALGLTGGVGEGGGDGEVGLGQAGQVELRFHPGVAHRHRAGGTEKDFAPDAHVLVGRHGVPVHKSDGEVLNAGSVDLDGQGVAAGVGDAGDVKLELAEGAAHLIFTGDLFAVEPDTGAIVDAAEVEPQGLA